MRCLALANALDRHGFRCRFLLPASGRAFLAVVARHGHEAGCLPGPLHRQVEALRDLLAEPVDLAVLDDYEATEGFERALREHARRLLVVDDLPERSHRCDVLVDPGPPTDSSTGAARTGGAGRSLSGPRYALLRPEFAALRPAALERRMAGGTARRILVAPGLTDAARLTPRIVEALLGLPSVSVDIALGSSSPCFEAVDALARSAGGRARLHVDVPNMAELVLEADLAVGAGGGSAYERCCLGLPSLAYLVADNQRRSLDHLARCGALRMMGREAEFDGRALRDAVAQLLGDDRARRAMSEAAAVTCDGLGTERVLAATLLGPRSAGVTLRPARAEDCDRIYDWRNDPLSRRMAIRRERIDYFDHRRWFARALRDPDRDLRIAEADGLPVGAVRADRRPEGRVLSWMVAPEARGLGLGKRMLRAFVAELEGPLQARIRPDNEASLRMARAAGLSPAGEADGIALWVR